jgi:hypothetical protein
VDFGESGGRFGLLPGAVVKEAETELDQEEDENQEADELVG